MAENKKRSFPVSEIRHFLEPGPIVLVSSKYNDETDIMTMGWHMVMEFSPSLIGCIIADSNHSHELIKKSRECVINLPTFAMIDTVVKIGNSSGEEIDKFAEFNLTALEAKRVKAPLIKECHANFECRLYDDSLVKKYNFFIFEVLHAHAATRPKNPQTIHYKGEGEFMIAGKTVSRKKLFLPNRL